MATTQKNTEADPSPEPAAAEAAPAKSSKGKKNRTAEYRVLNELCFGGQMYYPAREERTDFGFKRKLDADILTLTPAQAEHHLKRGDLVEVGSKADEKLLKEADNA